MFQGHVLIAEFLEVVVGALEHLVGRAREVLSGTTADAGVVFHDAVGGAAEHLVVDAEFLKDEGGDVVVHVHDAGEQVACLYVLLVVLKGQLLGALDGFLGFYGQIVEIHRLLFL